jgi:hypothetical protein
MKPESNPDVHWINDESTTLTIEHVRDLAQNIAYTPYTNQRQFYILQFIERASIPAQNALLKMVEEPPAHTQLLLTTQDASRILPTILSRTLQLFLDNPDHTQLTTEAQQELSLLYQQLTVATPAQLIGLAEAVTDRSAARSQITALIIWLHNQLSTLLRSATPNQQLAVQYTHHLQLLADTVVQLDQNVNVRLALENCFFQLRNSSLS